MDDPYRRPDAGEMVFTDTHTRELIGRLSMASPVLVICATERNSASSEAIRFLAQLVGDQSVDLPGRIGRA
ncbi:hypothetical protein [Herbiconiux ginsengi]|uniref:Uncharacterized protein n=1 Tax=Herbiconiux ginsengi TaxID=381665 RepID=A0A1H3TVJ8_9MICO|nr:hypothetical protein [Herbiconiux ginsengi]SDZ54132.1 hypothetical protein SAMN05216554_4519 [Herbiconiux ginsengi]